VGGGGSPGRWEEIVVAELPIWFPSGENREFLYDVTLNEIKGYFRRYALYQKWVSLFEFGVEWRRFDLIRVDCHKQKIAGFEFKISKYDLLNDEKWRNYLEYCNTFSFALPMEITKEAKEKLPSKIGILAFYKWKFGGGSPDEFSVQAEWLRRPRGQELSQENYIKVISLLLNRAKYRSGEIF